MYSCYIIDDELHSIDAMSRYIEKVPYLTYLGSSTEPKIGVAEILDGQKPDILLLDVQMPVLSGIDVAKLIPKEISIIFITGHSQFAYQAYENDVVDYLLKPVTFERFSRSIEKVIASMKTIKSSNHSFIIHGKRGQVIQLKTNEILFIEALDHVMHITSTNGTYKYKTTIKEVLSKLDQDKFLKTHRSFIVNTSFIKAIENNFLIMSNEAKIPISRGLKKAIVEKIKEI
jgi:DNA-binding LytR/AlgR family response regulator